MCQIYQQVFHIMLAIIVMKCLLWTALSKDTYYNFTMIEQLSDSDTSTIEFYLRKYESNNLESLWDRLICIFKASLIYESFQNKRKHELTLNVYFYMSFFFFLYSQLLQFHIVSSWGSWVFVIFFKIGWFCFKTIQSSLSFLYGSLTCSPADSFCSCNSDYKHCRHV